jgi:hypothetical protein
MSAERAFVHSWQVGPWTVSLSLPPLVPGTVRQAVAEWSPALPNRPLTAAECKQFREGLSAAVNAVGLST